MERNDVIMWMTKYHFLPILFLLVICYSCGTDSITVTPFTENIFPLEKNRFRISLVIDTTFDVQGPVVDQYYKKEQTGDTLTDLLGRTVYKLETFRSELEDGLAFNFQPDRVWTQFLDTDSNGNRFAERIEENKRFLVLKYPIFPRVRWNGNLFNNLPPETYRYQTIDTTVVVGNNTFNNCVLVVQQADTNNLISFKFAYEIFAPNIGRIKKFSKVLINDGPNGEFNPDRSSIYIEEIIDHNY